MSEILETNDYGQFKFMDANRDYSDQHVLAIKRSFEETGNFTRVKPIVVNENLEIIDGQHRFIACKELGYPVYYTIVTGAGVDVARAMNILHKGWTTDDYAKSYAATGDINYITYNRLKEEYGVSHTVMMSAVGVAHRGFKDFREGAFIIRDENEVRANLDAITGCAEAAGFTTVDRSFGMAIAKFLKNEQFDPKRMMARLKAAPHLIRAYSTVDEWTRTLEEIYNYNIVENKRVRLY